MANIENTTTTSTMTTQESFVFLMDQLDAAISECSRFYTGYGPGKAMAFKDAKQMATAAFPNEAAEHERQSAEMEVQHA